jgi:ParB family transcriptional regulator, chromosome partitioning protein
MKRSNQQLHIQSISLDKLKKSEENVRKVPHAPADIKALANSIDAHGQIQNLVVKTERDSQGEATGFYLVTAGEGRRLAQLLRVKRKKIKVDHPILCIIDDTHTASAVSLAENDLRRNMHPADQFTAFKRLVDAGQSIEDIAAQFSITPLVVKQRLKLANVAPEFIERYRKGTMDLSVLMALALTDDHAKQHAVWKSLRKHEQHAAVIRERLTQHEIAVDEPIVRFVGLQAYEKAGGQVRRDLFAEQTDDGYVMDVDLLRQIADEKFEREAAKIKAEGHAWVQVIPTLDYAERAEYGHVQTTYRAPTVDEAASLATLEGKRADLAEAADAAEDNDEQYAHLEAQIEAIDSDIDLLNRRREVPTVEQQAVSGVILSIDREGKLRIERGLLKPEDKARFVRAAKAAQRVATSKGPRIHSAALARRLAAHRTLGVQVALCEQPAVALVAITHRLALSTFYGLAYGSGSAIRVKPEATDVRGYGEDLEKSKALTSLAERREELQRELPPDANELLPWLLKQPEAGVLKVLACCVALTADGVHADDSPHAIDALAQAAQLDMRQWWSATAESYFGSVSKARILDVVREAISPDVAAALSDLKKSALAKAAEERLAGKGWLPSSLRVTAS